MTNIAVALVICASLAASNRGNREGPPSAPPDPQAPSAPRPSESPKIDQAAILERIKVLASDEYEGRAPGTKGEDLTVSYLVENRRSWASSRATPTAPTSRRCRSSASRAPRRSRSIVKGTQKQTFKWATRSSRGPSASPTRLAIADSDIVFVGYGVEAPEFNWNDFKDVDVKGKTIVVLVNDPPVPDPAIRRSSIAKMFGGKAMTYYGRWTYKYEKAREKGAAGSAHRARDRPGRLSVQRRPGLPAGEIRARRRRTRTWAARRSKAGSRSTPPRRSSRWPARTSTR